LKRDRAEWTLENYRAAAHFRVEALRASSFHHVELYRLVVNGVWWHLKSRTGGVDSLTATLAVEAAASVAQGVATDAPRPLVEAAVEWLRWLVEERRFPASLHGWKAWDRVRSEALQIIEGGSSSSPPAELGRYLLEVGYKPHELGSDHALERLVQAGYDRDYLREFLDPPPPVFWRGTVSVSWWDQMMD
jgi:hypothetical protein